MKFGLGMPALILYPAIMSDWEKDATATDILNVARTADEAGFEWLTISEHLIIPQEMVGVMGPRFPEAMVAAAMLAGATKRVKCLTYVLVLPYRHPVALAKEIATLDFLSGGRFTLGIGSGHLQREFEILGIPYEERGSRTDEYILAMKELWTKEHPSFNGRHVQFDSLCFEPKPAQKPHPPILIGGNTKVAMRRAASLGDGWIPWLVTPEKLPSCLDYLREQPGFRDNPRPFEVIMPLSSLAVEDYSHKELGETVRLSAKGEIVDYISKLQDAGATAVVVNPPRTDSVAQFLDWIAWFSAEIMPAFPARP